MKRNYQNQKWDLWYEELLSDQSDFPFVFTYDGEIYRGFPKEYFRLLDKNIKTVVFDRNGYLYHGVVKALADATRKAGVEF